MKVNGMLDIASQQTTSKPSKGNSKSDTLFQDILGQKSSQGSDKTTRGTKSTDSVKGSTSDKTDQATKDPQASSKTDGAEPTEAQEPQDTTEAAEDTEPVEEVEEPDTPVNEDEDQTAAEETAQGPQQIIPVYVPPQSADTTNAAPIEMAAPPVIQTAVSQESVQTVQMTDQTVQPELPNVQPQQDVTAQPVPVAETAEEPAAEVAPELVTDEMAAKINEAADHTSKKAAAETRPAAVQTEAEDFAAQVVKEAKTLVAEGEPQTEQVVPGADVEETQTDTSEESMTDTDEGSEQAASQKNNAPAPGTAQITSDGRVDFRTSAAQPLEAEHYIQPETREVIMNRVVDQVRSEITPGRTEFFVQLKPDHLGGLSIGLVAEDKGVVAKIMTSNQQVHNALRADMSQMIEMLREKGINVVQMEVIYDQTANSTMKDNSDNRQQNFSQDGKNGRAHGRVGEAAEEAFSMYDTISSYEALAEQGGSVEYSA